MAKRRSPSSRRAWIEMKLFVNMLPLYGVALLAEGVDRNGFVDAQIFGPFGVALLAEGVDRNRKKAKATEIEVGRPPRGGRG